MKKWCEPSSLDTIIKSHMCIWSHLCLHIEYRVCDVFDRVIFE